MLAVTGANGAGKSTLLRLIAGLLRPASGAVEARSGGRGRHRRRPPLPRPCATALKTALTVRQNLDFWRRLWGGSAVEAALERVGLAHLADLPAAVLSAGQKRRVAIARLHLAFRPLWLLDEPATRARCAKPKSASTALIADHLAAGGMAVVATHRPLASRRRRRWRSGSS